MKPTYELRIHSTNGDITEKTVAGLLSVETIAILPSTRMVEVRYYVYMDNLSYPVTYTITNGMNK